MSQEDRDYFIARAQQEQDRANNSRSPDAARIHRTLAEAYDRRARWCAVDAPSSATGFGQPLT